MKISNREKNLLILLLLAVLVYVFYSLVYIPQTKTLNSLKQTEAKKQLEYTQKESLIKFESTLDDMIASTKKKLFSEARAYFGDIDQEETIVILNDFAQKTGLKIQGINFVEPVKTSLVVLGYEDEQAVEAQATSSTPAESGATAEDATSPSEDMKPAESVASGESTATQLTQGATPDATSDNITTRAVELSFEANYNNLMDYLVKIEGYPKHISSSAMNVSAVEDKPLSGTISLNFFSIDSVDKYIPKEPSALEYNLVPKSLSNNPFASYAWARANNQLSNEYVTALNNLGVTTDVNGVAVSNGSTSSPVTKSGVNAPAVVISKDATIIQSQTAVTDTKTNAVNSVVLSSVPEEKVKVKGEALLYSFKDEDLKAFTLDSENTVASRLEENVKSKETMYSMSYSFGSKKKNTEVYLELPAKTIVINEKPQYISMTVDSDKKADNTLGLIVKDAKGKDYRVYMAYKIDWINKKEIKGVVLGNKNIEYPLTVKSIFIKENNVDEPTTNAKLSFAEMRVTY